MKLSKILKNYRIEHKISMREFAKRCGVSNAYISLLENEETKSPTLEMLNKISNGMNMDLDSLIKALDENTLVSIKSKKMINKVPVLGRVVAGIPINAIEEIIDYEEITEKMANSGNYFALQIKGDSMEPRIKEGDVVIIREQPDIESGDIAIVLVNGDESTIKKVIKQENGVMLVPFNKEYEPIFYSNEQIAILPLRILGKVVELRAKF